MALDVRVHAVFLQIARLRFFALHQVGQHRDVLGAGHALEKALGGELEGNVDPAEEDGHMAGFAGLDQAVQVRLGAGEIGAVKNIVSAERDHHQPRVPAGIEIRFQPRHAIIRGAAGDAEIKHGHTVDRDERWISLAGIKPVARGDAVAEKRNRAVRDFCFATTGQRKAGKEDEEKQAHDVDRTVSPHAREVTLYLVRCDPKFQACRTRRFWQNEHPADSFCNVSEVTRAVAQLGRALPWGGFPSLPLISTQFVSGSFER